MATNIRISEQKFYDELNNLSDFSDLTSYATHLKGCAGGKMRVATKVQIGTYKELRRWVFMPVVGTTQYSIKMSGVNWLQEGFNVGDTFSLSAGGGSLIGFGTVISFNGDEVYITKDSGTWLADNDASNQTYGDSSYDYLANTSDVTALNYKFGIIPNGDDINFLSIHTNTEQLFKIDGISTTPLDGAVSNISPTGNTAWVNGSVSCEYVGTVLDLNVNNQQSTWKEFEIIHDFIVTPFWLDGELESIKGEVEAPDRFVGTESLKYVFSTGFLRSFSDPNTERIAEFDVQKGGVSYYGESFNGNPSPYSLTNIAYYDNTESADTDRLSLSNVIEVQATITQNGDAPFTATQDIVIGMASLRDVEDYQYSNNKNWEEIFTFDSIRLTAGAADKDQNQFIDASLTYVTTSSILARFDIDLSASQSALLSEGDDYVLFAILQDDNATDINDSKQSLLRLDVNVYANNGDVTGLYDTERLELFAMPNDVDIDGSETGTTNGIFNIEEGIDVFSRFWIDTSLDATLTRYSVDLVCFNINTNEWFTLRTIDFDLSSSVVANDVQYISLDDTRSYILKEGNQFNYLKILTDNKVGNKQYYNIVAGLKIPWQTWVELEGVNEFFFNQSESYNGYNNDATNYSDNAPWGLRIITSADLLSDGVTTNYVEVSEEIDVYGYHEDETGLETYDCNVATYNIQGTSIENNLILDGYTELRGEFIPLTPPTFSTNLDFTTFETNGNRFAHGNRYYTGSIWNRGSNASIPPAQWENNQANDIDVFRNVSGTFFNKNSSSLYTSTTTTVLADYNATAFHGMYSTKAYENYNLSGSMYSNEADDDAIIFVIAFHIDDAGVEHTISLCATTGGVDFNPDPTYISGDTSTTIFDFKSIKIPPKYALVYNFGKDDGVILSQFNTSAPPQNWGDLTPTTEDLVFNVVRIGNNITANVTWVIDGTTYNTPLTYDLNDNTFSQKFLGSQFFGFGYLSQNNGGFKDVAIVDPLADYYGVIRIQPKDAKSDESMTEINTFRESPIGNLLIQKAGEIIISDIEWTGTTFVISCLINTEKISLDQQYKLSAQIGQITNS